VPIERRRWLPLGLGSAGDGEVVQPGYFGHGLGDAGQAAVLDTLGLARALQRDLATRYAIGLSSVKTILRNAGARRRR